jgi:hypothetical protein
VTARRFLGDAPFVITASSRPPCLPRPLRFERAVQTSANKGKEEKVTKSDKEMNRFGMIDNEGERYIVVELQRSTLFRRIKRHVLLNGKRVNRLKDGTFQIFDTGKTLRKVG